MKCEQGDIAKIIHAINTSNIGKTVLVETYIGSFKQGETFMFRGIECRAPVTDHFWWIAAEFGLKNRTGETPKAYIADSWLEPVRPTNTVDTTETEKELDAQ